MLLKAMKWSGGRITRLLDFPATVCSAKMGGRGSPASVASTKAEEAKHGSEESREPDNGEDDDSLFVLQSVSKDKQAAVRVSDGATTSRVHSHEEIRWKDMQRAQHLQMFLRRRI